MKLLGLDITRAARPTVKRAPKQPKQRDTLADIMPPFGTNPPQSLVGQFEGDLQSRYIQSDPRSGWYLALPSKLTPRHVLQILRSALGGDLWQQQALFELMLDSWSMLRKCCHELRSAVSQTRFVITPYAVPGKDPTPSATKKADMCAQALTQMRPDPLTDEKGFAGMIYDISDAFVNGLSMVELLWRDTPKAVLPRASAWVHPRHYTFTNGGRLVIADMNYRDYEFPEPDKFLIGQYSSRSGSVLGAGMLRPLAWSWSAVMYNREWMLEFAQRFGQPFRWATYKNGTPQAEIDKINDMLANMGNAGWGNFVEGTNINFQPPGTLGPQQPHMAIKEQADHDCQLLLLGQTLTSDVGDSGSRALGQVHSSVRRERVEDVARFCADVLSEQLLPAICRLNFGNDDECPRCAPDFTEQSNPLETAKVYEIFVKSGIPMAAEEFYRENKLKMPETGDKVIVGGKLGVLGSTDEEISAVEPANPEKAGDAAQLPSEVGKPSDEQQGGLVPMLKAFSVVLAKASRSKTEASLPEDIRNLLKAALPQLAKATAEDLGHVREAVNALIKAGDDTFDEAAAKLKAKLREFAERKPERSIKALADTMSAAFFNGVERTAKLIPSKVSARDSSTGIDTDKFAVVVVLRNAEDPEALLVKRAYDPEAGKWASPGGHVEQGEQPQDAARREIAEETGLELGRLVFLESDPAGDFYFSVIGDNDTAAAGGDASEVHWQKVSALPPLAFASNALVERAAAAAFGHKVNGNGNGHGVTFNVDARPRIGGREFELIRGEDGRLSRIKEVALEPNGNGK